jgi:hypothetical protein
MWLSLDSNRQYRFEESIDPVLFFQHLSHLLAPADTLVLGCYDALSDIRRYLAAAATPPAWSHFHVTETWDINRREHPHGAAFHLRADQPTLQQLAEFAGSATESIDLCDHIAAYSPEHPLLIYHGAFSEPLFVSTRIPLRNVEAFARGLGVPFGEIDFHQTYSSGTTPSHEPNV